MVESYPVDAAAKSSGYLLGFIEFDDQGKLFDRGQVTTVIDAISAQSSRAGQDLLIVVFVHGWKHNAKPGDENIARFRDALLNLSKTEFALSQAEARPARKIVGLYLGWRGLSITAAVLKELTFWDRKNTAQKVGHGEVTEVLNRLDLIRQDRDRIAPGGHSHTRLVVVGHSFGGAVVYSAVAQILASRFVQSVDRGEASEQAQGFGNLVVLINPAFEALLAAPLSDLANEHHAFSRAQLPLLAVLTSEADWATGIAFPIGRWLSTRFERERLEHRINSVTGRSESIDEHWADIQSIGHFEPYRTHSLTADPVQPVLPPDIPAANRAQSVLQSSADWEHDEPGSAMHFPGTTLTRTANSAGRNPYLIVKVDRALIPDHNDIWDPRIQEFISHLILIAGQSADPGERAQQRAAGSR